MPAPTIEFNTRAKRSHRRTSRNSVSIGSIRIDRMAPRFFAGPADWRSWLARHHKTEAELWVGFYKKASGRPSITWPESVDEALCFGWIDGIRKAVDESSYVIRFTPRKATSNWSAINTEIGRAHV